MAKLIPETLTSIIDSDPKRRAEKKVYEAFKSSLNDDWTVFYNISWLGKTHTESKPVDGQADFILTHPKKGILVLEVKGGRIIFEPREQQWYSIDRNNNEYKIDPFKQVVKSKHALIEKLKEYFNYNSINNWINIFQAVVFPDIADDIKYDPNIESPKEIIINGNDLKNIEPKLNSIFNYFRNDYRNSNDQVTLNALNTLIAKPVRLENSLSLDFDEESKEIYNLTAKQFNLLDFLNNHRKVLISGSAGSGKTFIAIEKAKRLVKEGFKTLLVCYNKPLADFIKKNVGTTKNLDVFKFDDLCIYFSKKTKTDSKIYTHYPDLLLNSINKINEEDKYDAIIVDEGQDFSEDIWVSLEECLKNENSIFYIFYDDNQMLYHKNPVFPINLNSFSLTENIRNTKAIYEKALKFYKNKDSKLPKSVGPVGRSVEKFYYSENNELKKLLKNILNRFIDSEKIKKEDIVILTPRNINDSILYNNIDIHGYTFSPNLNETSPSSKVIYFNSIYDFKGLERKIVIIIELDENLLTKDNYKELCYVGLSRAKNHMILFGTKSFFEKGEID